MTRAKRKSNPHEALTAYNRMLSILCSIVKECDRSLTTWVGSNAATIGSTRLSGRVQSMIDQQKTTGDAAGEMSAPTNTRRWSSDSETEERSPVLSSVSKKLSFKAA